ncbi:hypothetical protein PB01_19445 [Psychrobacillus glaciei]|uniref:Uncharacterized protein n=1 Tax=Psychrobacillus glaciei TaxID=2283160 RepID=A0A5J6SUR7_9BACI|nr:hypothetical protein [Psychrobacillus glaciei]QFG00795.1 hypothetical protein PB01_19445 [Psychrobacillus glaciei]
MIHEFEFPCNEMDKDNKYYKGKSNIYNNDCFRRCEYTKGISDFTFKKYNDYTLEKCCDVDSKFEKKANPEPEAILINRVNSEEKIVIEVKSLHTLYYESIKKDNKERKRMYYFIESFLNGIGELVVEKVLKTLEELRIEITPEQTNFF